MLKFDDLTNSQKRFIVALIEFDPKFKTEGVITRQECISIPEQLNAAHSCDTFVRPRWLRANKTERGAYLLPLPTEGDVVAMATAIATPVAEVRPVVSEVVSEQDEDGDDDQVGGSRLFKVIEESEPFDEDVEEFNQILRDFGIEV